MHNQPASFDEHVIRGVLANNRFGITYVNNLESLKSIFFVQEQYAELEKFIKSGNLKAIKAFNENQSRTGEYLEIMIFTDQSENRYCVTVYDSNTLEQDPQVIEVYQL
jgi:hypothetical protein